MWGTQDCLMVYMCLLGVWLWAGMSDGRGEFFWVGLSGKGLRGGKEAVSVS